MVPLEPVPTVEERGVRGVAVFSADRRHRYALTREWDASRPRMAWVMLNPSTADADLDDPTIRRCIGYAKAWGYGSLVVLNAFALRSTDPQELRKVTEADAIGPANNAAIVELTRDLDLVVLGWGLHGALHRRGDYVRHVLLQDRPVHALGLTRGGQPCHPLYLKGDLQPRALPREEAA